MAPAIRRTLFVFVAIAMLGTFMAPASGIGTGLQTDCNVPPLIMAVDEVSAGMVGTGHTVIEGRTISAFDVEVLGVLPNAIYPLVDMIVVKVFGPVIDDVGGIAAGFSGSPVYVDGKLLGAVAFGFAGNARIGGITPAEEMVKLINFPMLTTQIELGRVAQLALDLIEADTLAVGAPYALPIPVGVTGIRADHMDALQRQIDEQGLPLQLYPATGGGSTSSGSETEGAVLPGESLSAVLSSGDNAAFATGTATYCDGDTVIGFGHPFLWTGDVTLSLNEADIITVVDDMSDLFGGFKLATLGEAAGRIDFDGNVGVRGFNGQLAPSTPITSSVGFAELGQSREGRTDAYVGEELFFSLGSTAAFHLLANLDAVSGTGFRDGSSSVNWVVTGTRQDGSTFELIRDNKYSSEFSITDESIFELWNQIDTLQFNRFEEIDITSIDISDAQLFGDLRRLDIVDVAVATTSDPTPGGDFGILAAPGDTVFVDVQLAPLRSTGKETVNVELQIPDDFAGGFGSLEVRGGSGFFFDPFFEEPFFDEPLNGPDEPVEDFDGLLASLRDADHNYDLVVQLTLFEEFFEEEPPPSEPPFIEGNGGVGEPGMTVIKEVVAQDKVVSGFEFFDLEIHGEGPPFVFGELQATLTGDAEVPGPGEPDGSGSATIIIEGDVLFFDISVSDIEEATAAHIHAGATGEEGPVVVDLDVEFNGLSGVTFADPSLLADILANPELFYVNVHNAEFPAGAVRGQLGLLEFDDSVGFVTTTGEWILDGIDPFYFGLPGDLAFLGDWDGDGIKTPGLYRPATGTAYVRLSNITGFADLEFDLGVAGDVPFVGDWDGDGLDSFGVFRPSTGTVYLRNDLSTGPGDVSYQFGEAGHHPFVGDFNGDGIDELGFQQPNGLVYLEDGLDLGVSGATFYWGMPGDVVFTGDWDGDGLDTVGLMRAFDNSVHLRNSNSLGLSDIAKTVPTNAWMPLVN